MSGPITHIDDVVDSEEHWGGWGCATRVLTDFMRDQGGRLGVRHVRVPPGKTACPFHTHALEDEAFFVLEGRGVLRYGDTLHDIGVGDCISCPAGTGAAHQLANPYDADLVYLAIGTRDPNEVCTYPDSGKIMVRSLNLVGRLDERPYMDGETPSPRIFDLIAAQPPDAER